MFDDLERYDEAFPHFSKGNELDSRTTPFDPRIHGILIDRLKRIFNKQFLSRRQGFGSESKRPIIIVGMPRSGTTLTEQVLASHPDVFGAGELRYIGVIADKLADHASGAAAYSGFANSYLDQIGALAPTAARIIDKNPLNFEYLGLIGRLLPSARVIHCRRDPRDVAVSCYFQNFTTGQEWSFDLADIGTYFKAYRRLMDHWEDVLPMPVMAIDYEDMVGDVEATARRIVDFVGLPWDPACLAFHTAERAVRTASQWQVRQPIYRRSAGRWRRHAQHLAPFLNAAGLGDTPVEPVA